MAAPDSQDYLAVCKTLGIAGLFLPPRTFPNADAPREEVFAGSLKYSHAAGKGLAKPTTFLVSEASDLIYERDVISRRGFSRALLQR